MRVYVCEYVCECMCASVCVRVYVCECMCASVWIRFVQVIQRVSDLCLCTFVCIYEALSMIVCFLTQVP